jgi:phage-related protein
LERAQVQAFDRADQIFEFKVEADRVLCFFFVGKRLILTHGFRKTGDKTPKEEIARAEAYKRECEKGGRT